MSVPTQIKIAELDYDQILLNVIDFMKSDPTFADYDFSGSGLRMIARVLAYVTFYNAYYLTQAMNESFLDTAQLRASVASHARMLGYNIKGTQSARLDANVAVLLNNSDANTVTLPLRSQFSLLANTAYTFWNTQDVVLTKNTSTLLYEASDVELVEGTPLVYRFTVDTTNPTQRFVIPNANVDYTTIQVQVQDSADSNVVTNYNRIENYLTVSPTEPIFAVQETYNGFPELKFGNDVVGKALNDGNIIIVNYYISRGTTGNNIRGPFNIVSANIAGFVQGVTVADANSTPSSGGTDQEDIDNARFLAPLVYQAQNRCVTAEDYKTIILAAYGEHIAAINVFGGEEGDPNDPQERPLFGRVFVALKPTVGLRFTDTTQQFIEENIIKPRSVVGVIPTVINPDYIYLNITTSVKYDPKMTTRSKTQLEDMIRNNITTFAASNIEKFNTSFRFSKFIRVIDDSDDAITSSLTRLDLEKRIFPVVGASNQFVLKYGAPIRRVGSQSVILETTDRRFTYTNDAGVQKDKCFLYEQDGTIHVAYRDANNNVVIHKSDVGSVDLSSGVMSIDNFIPDAIEDSQIDIRIRIIPDTNDLTTRLNQLFTLDPDEIRIQLLNDAVVSDSDALGFFTGGILP